MVLKKDSFHPKYSVCQSHSTVMYFRRSFTTWGRKTRIYRSQV